MQQTHLWLDQPRARSTDPQSSHDAARRAAPKAASDAGRILACLREQGCVMTAAQVASRTGIAQHIAMKRLPELEQRGYVTATNRTTMQPGDVLRWMAREG